MGRARDLASDVAYYFGVGEGSAGAAEQSQPRPESRWLSAVRVAVIVFAAFALIAAVGPEGALAGLVVLVALITVLTTGWELAEWTISRRRGAQSGR